MTLPETIAHLRGLLKPIPKHRHEPSHDDILFALGTFGVLSALRECVIALPLLLAEIDRLQDEVVLTRELLEAARRNEASWHVNAAKARAERDRYREALEQIACEKAYEHESLFEDCSHCCTAREALNATQT